MIEWAAIFELLSEFIETDSLPSVSQIAGTDSDPYRVFMSTLISLRTRDEVTLKASERLFEKAPDIYSIADMDEKTIADLIYPAAFYRNKASSIKKCADIIISKHSGRIPDTREALLMLPGVGRKTANLTLNLGFGINAICVDTHVHRISNRSGWVLTKTPDDTELALEKILPEKYWIPLNEILVSYGQKVCTPLSPKCSSCVISGFCRRVGVTRHR